MSKRPRSRVVGAIPAEPAHKLSDKAARLWEQYYIPMNGAAQALNSAIINVQNILAAIIIEMEGFSPETHQFNYDRMVIVRRAVQPGQGNG